MKDSGAPPAAADLITVGHVTRPHGLHGEVMVRLETDFPQRFDGLRAAYLVRAGRAQAIEIIGHRPHRGGFLLTLRGIGDAEAAGQLRGAEIAVTRDAVVPLGPGQYYVFEIIGLRVRTSDGRTLGVVSEVMRGSAHDVYVVRTQDRDILVPAVREVVLRIDPAGGEMVVILPAGLEDPAGGR